MYDFYTLWDEKETHTFPEFQIVLDAPGRTLYFTASHHVESRNCSQAWRTLDSKNLKKWRLQNNSGIHPFKCKAHTQIIFSREEGEIWKNHRTSVQLEGALKITWCAFFWNSLTILSVDKASLAFKRVCVLVLIGPVGFSSW